MSQGHREKLEEILEKSLLSLLLDRSPDTLSEIIAKLDQHYKEVTRVDVEKVAEICYYYLTETLPSVAKVLLEWKTLKVAKDLEEKLKKEGDLIKFG